MGLGDQLVHLGVRRQVHDEVDFGVLDPADPARVGRVVPGQVLEQVAEVVRPRVLALVDAEDLVPVGEQAQRQVRPDLPRGAGDEDSHAATVVR